MTWLLIVVGIGFIGVIYHLVEINDTLKRKK